MVTGIACLRSEAAAVTRQHEAFSLEHESLLSGSESM